MSGENIHNGHRQRMRERIKKYGAESLEDHELLEVLLYYCIPRKNTNPIAHGLLKEFGNFYELFTADYLDISDKGEISENAALFITLTTEVAKRLNSKRVEKGEHLNTADKAGKFGIDKLKFEKVEVFCLLCLDAANRLISLNEINRGTAAAVDIKTRKLVELAVRYKAVKVILMHNHPGGNVLPSPEDVFLTNEAKRLLKSVEIEVVDHIIVNEDSYFSFLEHKMI